jgi:hypothetical protein
VSSPILSPSGRYTALNVAYLVAVVAAMVAGGGEEPRFLYVLLLFALCSTPLYYQRVLNDRFALFTIFMAVYFVFFGALDLLGLATGVRYSNSTGVLSESEAIILLSGFTFLLGYLAMARHSAREEPSRFAILDWPPSLTISLGLAFWAFGAWATWYWGVKVTIRSGESVSVGSVLTTVLMIGRYVLPLGLLLIAYAHSALKNRTLALVTIGVALLQVAVGFVSNTKLGAMLAGILVIVASVLINGKMPKAWLLSGIVFIVVAFPIFQSYRAIVVYEHGMTNAEAAADIGKAFDLALDNKDRVADDFGGLAEYHSQSFLERSSLKTAVEMIVMRTGKDVRYQYGYTLTPLFTVFIPRLLWPDKPDVATGVLVNTEFHVTDNDITYISPSHLGEMYWNFGWIGALAGMLLLGILMGWIGRHCDMSVNYSATRLVILAVTVFQLCVRFEGTIAAEYAVWLRSVVGILLLHWMISRSGRGQIRSRTAGSTTGLAPMAQAVYPNLMR